MRLALVSILFALAACDGGTTTADNAAAPPGYTLEVFAHDAEQIYLVSHDDGTAAAARVENETSALVAPEDARTLLAERQAAFGPPAGEDEAVRVRAGSLSLTISGKDNGDGQDSVHIEAGSGRGSFSLDASDEGDNDRARVRITGADAEMARDFINDAEELSPEVKTAMLEALGLTMAP